MDRLIPLLVDHVPDWYLADYMHDGVTYWRTFVALLIALRDSAKLLVYEAMQSSTVYIELVSALSCIGLLLLPVHVIPAVKICAVILLLLHLNAFLRRTWHMRWFALNIAGAWWALLTYHCASRGLVGAYIALPGIAILCLVAAKALDWRHTDGGMV